MTDSITVAAMITFPFRTDYWPKPGPLRNFDWSAWYDDDEPNDDGAMSIGFGLTEEAAISDLKDNFPRDED